MEGGAPKYWGYKKPQKHSGALRIDSVTISPFS